MFSTSTSTYFCILVCLHICLFSHLNLNISILFQVYLNYQTFLIVLILVNNKNTAFDSVTLFLTGLARFTSSEYFQSL